jgi:hypothetical protein
MTKSLRSLVAAAVLGAGVLGVSGSAVAAAPTGQWKDFTYCPYTNPDVASCVYSKTTSGSFKLGNADVPITQETPIVLQGGLGANPDGTTPFFNAVGADTLVKTRLKVPGGLLGLIDTGGLTGLLITAFNNAVAAENNVYATAELAGPVQFSLANAITADGTAVTLPIRVHLENPFLGSSCYIGSSSHPVTLNLTTGTTSPPAPNTALSGSPGDLLFSDDFSVITTHGIKLVDNAFAAPAASNCGLTFLDRLLVTPALNLKQGLPSAAGKNTAIQQGDTQVGNAADTAASVQ